MRQERDQLRQRLAKVGLAWWLLVGCSCATLGICCVAAAAHHHHHRPRRGSACEAAANRPPVLCPGRIAAACGCLQATSQLDAQLQVAGQHRQQLAALQQSEQELQAALERQEVCTAQQEACAAQHAQQVSPCCADSCGCPGNS